MASKITNVSSPNQSADSNSEQTASRANSHHQYDSLDEVILLANSLPLISQHEVPRPLCLANGFGQSTMDGAQEDAESNEEAPLTLDGHREREPTTSMHLPGPTDIHPTRRLSPLSFKDTGLISSLMSRVIEPNTEPYLLDPTARKTKKEVRKEVRKDKREERRERKSDSREERRERRSDNSSHSDSKIRNEPRSVTHARKDKHHHRSDNNSLSDSKSNKTIREPRLDVSQVDTTVLKMNRERRSEKSQHEDRYESKYSKYDQSNPFSCDCFTHSIPGNPEELALQPSHQLPNSHFPQHFAFHKQKKGDMSIGTKRGDYLYVKTFTGKDEPWFALLSGRNRNAPPLATVEQPGRSLTMVQADIRPPILSKDDARWMKINAPRYADGQHLRPEWWRSGQLELFKEHKEAKSFEFEAHIPSANKKERFQWQNCMVEGIRGLENGLGKRLMRAETREVVAGWTPPNSKKHYGDMVFLGDWTELGQDFEVMAVVGILIGMLAPDDVCGTRCPKGRCPTPLSHD